MRPETLGFLEKDYIELIIPPYSKSLCFKHELQASDYCSVTLAYTTPVQKAVEGEKAEIQHTKSIGPANGRRCSLYYSLTPLKEECEWSVRAVWWSRHVVIKHLFHVPFYPVIYKQGDNWVSSHPAEDEINTERDALCSEKQNEVNNRNSDSLEEL